LWKSSTNPYSNRTDLYNNGNPVYDYSQHNADMHVFFPLSSDGPVGSEINVSASSTTLSQTYGNGLVSRKFVASGSAAPPVVSLHEVSEFTYKFIDKRNNYYLQSHLPASDYHYSWVTSSLGDNYSVRSGKQKVFGYWPKDGILSSSAGFDSAITFPTASQIVGS